MGAESTVHSVACAMRHVCAVGWGLLASALSFLTANFFTKPRPTFTVAAFQDMLALVVLPVMAILTSQLVAGLRREAEEARRGQQVGCVARRMPCAWRFCQRWPTTCAHPSLR